MAEARGVRVREHEAVRRRWASAASSAGSACRSGCAGAVEPSAQRGRASAFGTCVPPFFSAAPHSLSTLGVLVERQVLGPRRVADSGSGLGEFPVMLTLLVPPHPGSPGRGWAVPCLTGVGFSVPTWHTRGPFSSPF